MEIQYEFISRIESLYSKLQDDLSRKIFWARLKCDISFSLSHIFDLFSLSGYLSKEEVEYKNRWKEDVSKLITSGKKIILYGAGACGKMLAEGLLADGCDFYAFCDKKAATDFADIMIMNKPIISPEYLFENADDCYVIISTRDYRAEVTQYLEENEFHKDHILNHFDKLISDVVKYCDTQYFCFPEYFENNTALIDAGCFDGQDSIYFANWCKGKYSKIIAFEPDEKNYEICRKNFEQQKIQNIELIKAGLSADGKEKRFISSDTNGYSNYMIDEEKVGNASIGIHNKFDIVQTIKTVTLDALTKDIKVGFIKMDIEGAELNALHGAKETIKRDYPFLAISVYHRKGDLLAIMDFINAINPEYKFFLRHHGDMAFETVLYAAIVN